MVVTMKVSRFARARCSLYKTLTRRRALLCPNQLLYIKNSDSQTVHGLKVASGGAAASLDCAASSNLADVDDFGDDRGGGRRLRHCDDRGLPCRCRCCRDWRRCCRWRPHIDLHGLNFDPWRRRWRRQRCGL